MTTIEAQAPAKVNLTLHVTGRRADGYHLLDSLVVFADSGAADRLRVSLSDTPVLHVRGPRAAGVPVGPENLVLRAAAVMGVSARIDLEKHLPAAAGIGGGSADAAAVLRALSDLGSAPLPPDSGASLGADVPVCVMGQAARMRGIGDDIAPLPDLPAVSAVLVNPGVDVPTPRVFAALDCRQNAPMPEVLPHFADAGALIHWLRTQRNDLEWPAEKEAPVICDVLDALNATGAALARMSGSGATCFGLYLTAAEAAAAAARLEAAHPEWWVAATQLS